MSLARHRMILAGGIERIDVRNLLPPSDDITSFSPSIDIVAVCRDGDSGEVNEEHPIYKGGSQSFSCNPSWTSYAGFDTAPFAGQSKVTELLVKFYGNSAEVAPFHEKTIDLTKLFRLDNFSLASLNTIPKNSIFLWVDDKSVLMENSLYFSLRKSKQIKARNGSMATVDDKLMMDSFSGDVEEGATEGILTEMNSILVDEDEKNIALREDIEVGMDRVAALRSEAESFLSSNHTTRGAPASSTGREPDMALQQLELLELQALVEKMEAEAEADERALAEEEQSLALAKQHLEESLLRWKDITTQDSRINTTEQLIAEKKNELVHTKFLLDARRLKLFGQLSTIYPITKVLKDTNDRTSNSSMVRSSVNNSMSPSTGSSADGDEDRFAIRGVELPMVIDNSLKDDEQISTALGYIVHILLLTSKYLQVSLRYDVIYSSSRSMIRDAVLGRGSTLPLFKRGVERERFDRALIWLQKNIEQLMDSMGYKYSRKFSMLYNLSHLFDCEICPKLLS
mmetsp:Transcript_17075/g.28515  ORF Transcript_17075/g.28515 Transcript_17075/m.28515 type:complete len:512 (-) Transcript_17075:159-1694(-)